MNYQTKLMQKILTNEKAQEIIDYVSQIYGDSYVGLWLFQAIGTVLGPAADLSEQLMYETSPATTTLLIDYWEQQYGIQGDPTMTLEQRRARVMAAISSKGACNPARLAREISAALGGAPVEILEFDGKSVTYTEIDNIVIYGINSGQEPNPEISVTNAEINQIVVYGNNSGLDPDEDTSIANEEIDEIVIYGHALNQNNHLTKNKFIVNIRAVVRSYAPAIAIIEKMKPAHLIYTIQGVTQENATADVNVGRALTIAELYALKASNSPTVLLIPTIQDNTLLIRRRNPIAGTETIEQTPHTSDGQGNVTLTTMKATDDGQGNVTLNTVIV